MFNPFWRTFMKRFMKEFAVVAIVATSSVTATDNYRDAINNAFKACSKTAIKAKDSVLKETTSICNTTGATLKSVYNTSSNALATHKETVQAYIKENPYQSAAITVVVAAAAYSLYKLCAKCSKKNCTK